MSNRYAKKPPLSNWGEFGPDDQIGRLNYLTPEKVLQGVAEVKVGKTFCLSLPLNLPGSPVLAPSRKPPKISFYPVGRRQVPFANFRMDLIQPEVDDVCSDDMAVLYLQHSTQWDGFGHYGCLFDADADGEAEVRYYNGFKGGEDIVLLQDTEDGGPYHGGALKLGIEHFAQTCVQGRGVLIDIEKHFGRARRAINFDDLSMILEKDHIVVEKGDMVLFRTGLAQMIYEMGATPDADLLNSSCAGLDGADERLLNWITDSGLAAIAMDNFAIELQLGGQVNAVHERSVLPVHRHCLFNLGVPLGELWHLTELADWLRENGRSRFLLTAPPLRLPGAVGSPLTPIATV